MSAKLDMFNNIKGFLHPDEENTFMNSLLENVERDLLSRLAPIVANLLAI
jgi:hypothetical protein